MWIRCLVEGDCDDGVVLTLVVEAEWQLLGDLVLEVRIDVLGLIEALLVVFGVVFDDSHVDDVGVVERCGEHEASIALVISHRVGAHRHPLASSIDRKIELQLEIEG